MVMAAKTTEVAGITALAREYSRSLSTGESDYSKTREEARIFSILTYPFDRGRTSTRAAWRMAGFVLTGNDFFLGVTVGVAIAAEFGEEGTAHPSFLQQQ